MNLTTRSRNIIILFLAAVGPFALVWFTVRATNALRAPSPGPMRVVHFSDYFTEPDPSPTQSLPGGTQLWKGSPGNGVSFFNGMTLAGDAVALVSDGKFVAIDKNSGAVLQDTLLEGTRLRSLGGTALTADRESSDVWIYSWQSGDLGRYDVRADFIPLEIWRLEPSLKSVQWVKRGIIASGPFQTELLRIYNRHKGTQPHDQTNSNADTRLQAPVSTVVTTVLGRPLFPRLVTALAKPLNVTFLAVKPAGDKIAVAFQWSDRIHVYDLSRMTLERSIAGPVESKLDFAVARLDGRPIFTVTDETTYSYMDVAVTNHAILALYAGRERRKHPGTAGLGGEIHAFTWDGRLAGVWRLQDPAQEIAVDSATEIMYTLRWRPSHSIVAIDIRQLLNSVRKIERTSPR